MSNNNSSVKTSGFTSLDEIQAALVTGNVYLCHDEGGSNRIAAVRIYCNALQVRIGNAWRACDWHQLSTKKP